jgi:hypothetical protein
MRRRFVNTPLLGQCSNFIKSLYVREQVFEDFMTLHLFLVKKKKVTFRDIKMFISKYFKLLTWY